MTTYTAPEDEELFAAIGRLVISWGHLEISLDCMVEIMYHGFDGAKIDREIPRALQRKLTFLRRAFKQLPIPEKSIQGYTTLFSDIEAAAQIRHDVIHGVVIEHIKRSGEATMARAIRNKQRVEKREYKVTTKTILNAAVNANHLSSKMFCWLDELFKVLDELQKRHDQKTQS